MVLVPDPEVAEDPFQAKTLILYCVVKDPPTGRSYDKDPCYVARKAEAHSWERVADLLLGTGSSTSSTAPASTRTSTPATT
jgi:glutamine synthetase